MTVWIVLLQLLLSSLIQLVLPDCLNFDLDTSWNSVSSKWWMLVIYSVGNNSVCFQLSNAGRARGRKSDLLGWTVTFQLVTSHLVCVMLPAFHLTVWTTHSTETRPLCWANEKYDCNSVIYGQEWFYFSFKEFQKIRILVVFLKLDYVVYNWLLDYVM